VKDASLMEIASSQRKLLLEAYFPEVKIIASISQHYCDQHYCDTAEK